MAGLAHSFSVQAIGWTGSGDGFIVCGMEVILWKKNNTSWEITWKSKVKFPQSLISATYSADGLIATAAKLSVNSVGTLSTEYACVSVYHNTENYVQLRHPHPVTKIQWRPSNGYHILPPFKDILLTCCIDGTVRLWSEIDNAGARKHKEQQSFYVIAVIEINQCLNGTLENDIFIEWAVELGSPISQIEGSGYSLFTSNSEHDIVGKCEWLISMGPNHTVTFWAIHCLDDLNPLRFPRVTLWKKQNLLEFESYSPSASDITIIEEQLIFVKALILRNTTSGPPVECSLIQLLPGNLLCWSQLYSQKQNNLDVRSTRSCLVNAVLNINGHTGNIIQLDIHPYREIELAASLDSNGFLFFWSLPTVSNNTWGMQMVGHPSWKLLHQIDSRKLFNDANYSSIKWSPSVSDEDIFLLLGHDDGVDCLHITVSEMNTSISCDKIFTVPFTGLSHVNGPPDQISAIHVTSSSEQPFYSNNFLLFALWTNKLKFQALSWKIMLHAANASSSSQGKLFNAVIDLGSSAFPDSQNEAVTSVFVCAQSNCMLSTQLFSRSYTSMLNKYHMATGYSSGILKLWKMSYKESQISLPEFVPWELVGTITAHDGAVNTVSLSSDGSKISTFSINNRNNSSTLHIWEPIHLVNGGSFLLEDEISIDGSVVSLDWLSLGNGHFLLAVFMPSEVRIYSERRSDLIIEKTAKKTDMHIWCCIAISHTSPISHGFLWGSMLAPVIIHEKQFSLYSRWSYKAKGDGRLSFPIFVQTNAITCSKLLENGGKESGVAVDFSTSKTLHNHDLYSDEIPELHSLLDIADALNKTVEVYHPKVLLQHLYLGNWKRAYAVLKHLVKAIKFGEVSATSSVSPLSEKSYCSVPEINLSSYFEEVVLEESSNKDLQWGQNLSFQMSSSSFQHYSPADDMSHNFSPATNLKSELMGFIDAIEKSGDTNALTNIEKSQLLAVIDLLLELGASDHSSVYDSLDAYGRRLWVIVQFQRLYSVRKFGKSICEEPCTDSRYFAWASQSECQDNLLNSLLSSNPSWSEMRNLGIGFWFTDTSQLRVMMEKLARSQYLMKRDPKDCALLYLALNRLQVLAGLFKVSRDEKDKLLVGFLSRNFKEEKNKAAALKNAYVLMGRHQLELAIAFFLLGGDPSSAVTVCAKNLGDEQLALVICRLIEGHGGQLEHQLISNTLIPKALDKKDYWLASLLEWQVGNYTSSVNSLLDSNHYSEIYSSALYNLSCCLDPDIGQYCAALATKNSMKNSVGEYPIMVLSKLAKFMSAKAFNRCGFPLEALECLSSSSSSNEAYDQISLLNIDNHMIFRKILRPFSASVCNWQQAGIADTSELNTRFNFAMQYITKSLKSHPSWLLDDYTEKKRITNENDVHEDEQLKEFIHELKLAIGTLERKYFLKSADIANEILVFTNTRGLFFHGCLLLHVSNIFRKDSDLYSSDECSTLPSTLSKLLIKASQEISCIFCRFVVCCSLTDSILGNKSLCQFHRREVCLSSIVMSLRSLRPLVKLCESSLVQVSSLDPLECSVHFASYWFGKNVNALMSIIGTFVNEPIDHHSSIEVRINALMKLLQHTEWINANFLSDGTVGMSDIQQSEAAIVSQIDYEMWQVIGAILWIHLFKYSDNQFRDFLEQDVVDNGNIILDTIKLLLTSTDYISSMLTRQLAFFLRQKASESQSFTFAWLNRLSHISSKGKNSNMEIKAEEVVVSQYKTLWELSVQPNEICNSFVNERLVCFPYKSENVFAAWKYVCKATLGDNRNGLRPKVKAQGDDGNFIPTNEESASVNNIDMDPLIETKRQISSPRKSIAFFHNPVEILKRNGELLEAICSNSIDEHQLAAASNRKGLCFFNYKSDQNFRKHDEYLWLGSDWPQNGWGGCESKLGSSYVSGGIGLRSKSEAHLGFGDGAIDFNSLSGPERCPTIGDPFESPGYARIGASSLSWYEQEEFDEFTDPPATVTNVSSQALSRHPCRPFLLVGSINTHIYLWEFGKDSATATYGVLPSANVPPPYALASVSALQFDHCGHRFASAAFDGTVCTWQLEVGGRGNAYPTESSHCFSNYAADIDYVAASGSIIAAAGSNTNGVNVVLWDTLAPRGTSQASLVCHEGGARSLSVFDNDIGTGSISPLIVTGGKSGDVGLHDFRFIATGKTKRNKCSSHQDNGMLWYIPKAHLGSVTKVITVPNTSLFLTGSKDGDIKLWDAKNTRLVYHWQKMHERHTFLQPYSRSIGGGVVRAAVTDIQVLPRGFLTCGGDGCVKLVQLK